MSSRSEDVRVEGVIRADKDDQYDEEGQGGVAGEAFKKAFNVRQRRAVFNRSISQTADRNSFSNGCHVIAVLTSGGDSCGQFRISVLFRLSICNTYYICVLYACLYLLYKTYIYNI